MQIKTITVNAANRMTVGQGIQANGNPMQREGDIFGPECKVTISQEGRNLNKQQETGEEKNAQSTRAERKLFRQQEEAEQNRKSNEGYREQLEKIEKTIDSLNKSYKSEADKKTIEKEQEVLRAMRDQKQAQMEENQKRAKEAQQMAMQSAKYQEEIDENNRELLTVLKSLEEAEKAEEDQEYKEEKGDSSVSSSTFGTNNSTGDIIQNSAVQFMAASMERDLGVEETLAGLSDGGLQLLDQANTITRHVIKESEDIRAALDDEAFTEDEKAKLMESFQERVGKNNLEVRHSREQGLHMLQTARDYKIKRIADDPLRGMEETRKSMMQSAIDTVIGEAVQGGLDKASQELEDEVEKLIDERNDIDRSLQDNEEDEENRQSVQEEENLLRQQEKNGSPSGI